MQKKMLPIGIENFEEMITSGFYYIDKTGLIKELLTNWGQVNLFTRPRRFGKSLNMSMLKSFLDLNGNPEVFAGLKISEEKALVEQYQNQYPVISITLKGVNGLNYEQAFQMFCLAVGNEAMRFQFLSESEKLTDEEKGLYKQLITIGGRGESTYVMEEDTLTGSLQTLSKLLQKHYEKSVVVLIDEYDVPLQKAYVQEYYDQMVVLLRNFMDHVLKTNDSLKFAVLTGCMRISKESIFTGLNNLRVLSVADVKFDEYFGFTDTEVKDLLEYYGLSDRYEKIREWYDGYRFGNVDVYCPWDVVNYCDVLCADQEAYPQNYWINTSSNDVVKKFIEHADKGTTKREIERLVAGESIRKEIHQELTYQDMYNSVENIWSVLFTTGYLTMRGKREGNVFDLAIPNLEIRNIYTTQIMSWFKETVQKDGAMLQRFCDALQGGDAESAELEFTGYLRKTISIRDTFVQKKMKENFYHGILLGILGFREGWDVSSNKESGQGYSDICIEEEASGTGMLLEIKYAEDGDLEKAAQKALDQIDEKEYEEIFEDNGITSIRKYGIACYKKRCRIICE